MRYAIYYTPDRNNALTVAAANWLGRNAFGGPTTSPERPADWTPQHQSELVRDAAHYGFHATLKAPFLLAEGVKEHQLLDAFAALKLDAKDIVIPSLVLRQIDGFFALVPETLNDKLNEIAATMVREFDPFRAPLSEADIARRNPDKLSDRQRQYLGNWGYPYIFEEFFFHMTLTGRVTRDLAPSVLSMLERHFADFIGKPHTVAHLAIFVEPSTGADFTVRSIRPIEKA